MGKIARGINEKTSRWEGCARGGTASSQASYPLFPAKDEKRGHSAARPFPDRTTLLGSVGGPDYGEFKATPYKPKRKDVPLGRLFFLRKSD